MTTLHVNSEDQKYYGVAFCHTKDQQPVEYRFDELKPYHVEWFYINPSAGDDFREIKGSLYDPSSLAKVSEFHPEGYDFVVMPYCPHSDGPPRLHFSINTASIIAASCLLKKGGMLLHNSFRNTFLYVLNQEEGKENPKSRGGWTKTTDSRVIAEYEAFRSKLCEFAGFSNVTDHTVTIPQFSAPVRNAQGKLDTKNQNILGYTDNIITKFIK